MSKSVHAREELHMKIKAAVLREFNKPLSVEVVDLAPPKEKEVLVKTAFTGFCHSDFGFII
jgi:S-(hydroxymethyl)glutathione dehydrogenase/alcohol dehydrogenase